MLHGVNLILCSVTNAILQLVTSVQQALLFASFLPCNYISASRAAITMSYRHKSTLKHLKTHDRCYCIRLQHFLVLADTADCATGQALACERLWQNSTGEVCISNLTILISCCLCAALGGMQKHFAFTCLLTARAPADSP